MLFHEKFSLIWSLFSLHENFFHLCSTILKFFWIKSKTSLHNILIQFLWRVSIFEQLNNGRKKSSQEEEFCTLFVPTSNRTNRIFTKLVSQSAQKMKKKVQCNLIKQLTIMRMRMNGQMVPKYLLVVVWKVIQRLIFWGSFLFTS